MNLVVIIKEALDFLGGNSDIINNIDHHSTIELVFDDLPNLSLSDVDDKIIHWSQLVSANSQMLVHYIPRIIESLVAEYEWMANGRLQRISGSD